jgi:hypothetical protein
VILYLDVVPVNRYFDVVVTIVCCYVATVNVDSSRLITVASIYCYDIVVTGKPARLHSP